MSGLKQVAAVPTEGRREESRHLGYLIGVRRISFLERGSRPAFFAIGLDGWPKRIQVGRRTAWVSGTVEPSLRVHHTIALTAGPLYFGRLSARGLHLGHDHDLAGGLGATERIRRTGAASCGPARLA